MQQYLIIVAGGTGSRMQNERPKQFINIHGKEIILHTLKKFIAYNKNINVIIATGKDFVKHVTDLVAQHAINAAVVEGGNTRYESVKNALNVLPDINSVVAIHDAARPMVSVETIKKCFEVAEQKGNAIPAVSLNESIREVNGENNKAVNRNNYKIIQTPQCFRVSEIKKAFELPYNETFTDDASVLEAAGGKINLIEGNEENFKITLPKDLEIAKLFLNE